MASQVIPDVQHRNMCQSQEDVILESNQNVGVIVLNRQKYLNALNLSMVNKIFAALAAWSETKAVIIMRGIFITIIVIKHPTQHSSRKH